MEKTKRKTISGIFNKFWKRIIGLEPNATIKSLSEKELSEFYKDLGYEVFAVVVLLGLILFITNTTVGTGMFSTLLKIVFGVVAFFLILKLCWSRFKVVDLVKEEEVECSFYTTKRGSEVDGFLVYEGDTYMVEDFALMGNELSELSVIIFEDEKSEIRIFYSNDEGKFIKITEKLEVAGISPSYKFMSWLFFAVCGVAIIAMLVVPLWMLL